MGTPRKKRSGHNKKDHEGREIAFQCRFRRRSSPLMCMVNDTVASTIPTVYSSHFKFLANVVMEWLADIINGRHMRPDCTLGRYDAVLVFPQPVIMHRDIFPISSQREPMCCSFVALCVCLVVCRC